MHSLTRLAPSSASASYGSGSQSYLSPLHTQPYTLAYTCLRAWQLSQHSDSTPCSPQPLQAALLACSPRTSPSSLVPQQQPPCR